MTSALRRIATAENAILLMAAGWGTIFLFVLSAPRIWYLFLLGAALLSFLRFMPQPWRPMASARSFVLLTACFTAWALLGAIWSLDSFATLERLVRILVFLLSGVFLVRFVMDFDAPARRLARLSLAIGLAIFIVGLSINLGTGGGLTEFFGRTTAFPGRLEAVNPAAIALLAIALWPCLTFLPGRGLWWALLPALALTIFLAVEFGLVVAALATVVGTLVFLPAVAWPGHVARALAVMTAAFILLAPLVPQLVQTGPWLKVFPDNVQVSVYHRAEIWSFTAEKIAERPLLGWGLESARRIPERGQTFDINRDLGYDPPRFDQPLYYLPLHPHNAALEVWLELGFIGAVIFASVCFLLPYQISRAGWTPTYQAAAMACFVSAFVIAMFSFGLWQSRWLPMLAVAAALLVAVRREAAGDRR